MCCVLGTEEKEACSGFSRKLYHSLNWKWKEKGRGFSLIEQVCGQT